MSRMWSEVPISIITGTSDHMTTSRRFRYGTYGS